MTKLTGQNRFMRSLSGGYKVTNGSHVHAMEWKKQRKCSSWKRAVSQQKLTVDERVKNADGE